MSPKWNRPWSAPWGAVWSGSTSGFSHDVDHFLSVLCWNNICMATYVIRPTLKICRFAVLLPTHQNWPYPKNIIGPPLKISLFPLNLTLSKREESFGKIFFSSSKKVNEFQNMRKSCSMTKPTKWPGHPAKTQIRLIIRPAWSESSLSAWRNLGILATQWTDNKDSDQTGRMPRLIWVFAGCTGSGTGKEGI